jgi:TatA/E family protein of Tat protein translocase
MKSGGGEMFGLSGQELLLIVILALVVLGPQKLPEVARTLGKGYQELKKAMDGVKGTMNVNEVFTDMMKDDAERPVDKKKDRDHAKRDDSRHPKG